VNKSEYSWLDNFIGFFSPESKLKRLKARAITSILERKFEGAATGRRTDGWFSPSTSANTEISTGLIKLRDRSRDLRRNNPYAHKGIQIISSNTIGPGIKTQVKSKNKTKEENFDNLWRAWSETTACDFEGRHNLFGLQTLIMDSLVESGEVLIRKRRVRISDTQPLPLQIQVLESDFLDGTKLNFQKSNGNVVIQGIEFDKNGKRISYLLFDDHPGGFNQIRTNKFVSNPVNASDVIHVLTFL